MDAVAVDAGGEIDLSTLGSTRTGVIQLKERFEEDMRSKHKDKFKNAGDLDDKRIETAILTGYYPYGKMQLDVVDEAIGSVSVLTNDVIDIIESNGGAANYDIILLTGGGASLIYEPLKHNMPDLEFQLVEPDREKMRFANAFGAAKMFNLLERLGVL